MPELRRDPVIGRWVIISSERGKRPSDLSREPDTEDSKICPFCPENEHLAPHEILAYRRAGTGRDKPGWWVRVLPNKYPVLGIEGDIDRAGQGMYDKMNGLGAHEVIIETEDHYKGIDELDEKKAEDIIWAYRDRFADLKRDSRFEYILIFKNRGFAAGASIAHPHSQLIALPMVPIRVDQEIKGSRKYYEYKERCVFCDMVRQEISDQVRVVSENDMFIAFCPYASRFPFEIWILPKVHDSRFDDVQENEVKMLTHILRNVFRKLNRALDNPPFNYLIHTAPVKEEYLPHYHWHIEIMPKLTRLAGFEWGTGCYINPTPPEEAAKYLREIE
jgi:UDPglucose--hexose-1-phosphate uridylyltransferase